jgi:hypothetical protein
VTSGHDEANQVLEADRIAFGPGLVETSFEHRRAGVDDHTWRVGVNAPIDQVVGAGLGDASPARVWFGSHPWLASCSQAIAMWSAGNIRRLRSFQE